LGPGATFIDSHFPEELALADTPETATIGQSLVGPTIIAVVTESREAALLARHPLGDEVWCQGFSAQCGSDLASLQTQGRARWDIRRERPKNLDQLRPFATCAC